jgi:type IV pilus assembly protein PilA
MANRIGLRLRVVRPQHDEQRIGAEPEHSESGFTLIELMVVLLIMAILLAIAIPTFLGVKGGAQDRAAQSNLTNGLTSAKALYSTAGLYTSAASFVATMSTQEPELSFTTGSLTTAGNKISFQIATDGQQIVLEDYSANNSGTCWVVSDNDGSSAVLGGAPTGDAYAAFKVTTANLCQASTTTGTLASAPPAGFWNAAYPTTTTAP